MLLCLLQSPGDVLPCRAFCLAVEALVGGGGVEWSEVAEIRSEFVVVEVRFVDVRGELRASAIPCCLYGRVGPMDIGGEHVYRFRLGIASHECYACDVAAILLHEAVDGACRERAARVSPKVRAVATGTAARTVGYVDGESYLVRYLLKNY